MKKEDKIERCRRKGCDNEATETVFYFDMALDREEIFRLCKVCNNDVKLFLCSFKEKKQKNLQSKIA
jgi:hypothetical protein